MMCSPALRPSAVRSLTWISKKGELFWFKRINRSSEPDLAELCTAEDRERGRGTRTASESGFHIHSSEDKDS